jgi:hypothetical protein
MSEPPENTGRKADGTFASGNRANPSGKPKGTRHRATMMAEKLLDKDAAAIIKKLVAKALAGEPWVSECGYRRSRPRIPIGSRPPIPI